jgi:hypothetical protein
VASLSGDIPLVGVGRDGTAGIVGATEDEPPQACREGDLSMAVSPSPRAGATDSLSNVALSRHSRGRTLGPEITDAHRTGHDGDLNPLTMMDLKDQAMMDI